MIPEAVRQLFASCQSPKLETCDLCGDDHAILRRWNLDPDTQRFRPEIAIEYTGRQFLCPRCLYVEERQRRP